MPGLDDARDALKGLGSAFLLSFFFPIVLFTAINCGLVILLLGLEPAGALATKLQLDSAVGLAVALFIQLAAAWVAAPMTATLRRVIEGEMLPAWLKLPMMRQAWRAADATGKDVKAAVEHHGSLNALRDIAIPQLIAARATGKALCKINDLGELHAANAALYDVTRLIPGDPTPRGRRRMHERLVLAIAKAAAALQNNAVGLTAGWPEDMKASARLALLHRSLIDVMQAAVEDAERAKEEANGRWKEQFVNDDIRASQLGNLRAVMERYTTQAYGVSFEYMWPRVQAVIAENDAVAIDITRSKNHIEFGVMMIAGTALTCAVWLVLSFAYASPWLFLATGAVGPLLISLFHRMALEGQKSLTQAVRAAIDVKRDALLEDLNATVKTHTRAEECELWRNLERWSLGEKPQVTIR